MSSLPARSKTTEKRWRHCFPHYKSMGAFCCHGNQSFDPICPKNLCSLSPPHWCYTYNLIKIGQHTISCESVHNVDGRTDDGPLVYYTLTLWAFGSGKLKRDTGSNNCKYLKIRKVWFCCIEMHWNGKQFRPWSDCSCQICNCTVCWDLPFSCIGQEYPFLWLSQIFLSHPRIKLLSQTEG